MFNRKRKTIELDVWVAWNEDGDHAAHIDKDQLHALMDEELGGFSFNFAKLTVTVPAPKELEATAIVSDDAVEQVSVKTD